ncbi:efflux RND transporter periplasmic adaptor subunit [Zobellella maritima]|uniref:efflux RND transporter periplasmic adaptor subunit n=1 Tax=Zobellella maritima TaxID=2059725 RepID=UPI000E3054EE|nr:efflux RND transporter periplasmic adaptor subunit [Zobellella maritima]
MKLITGILLLLACPVLAQVPVRIAPLSALTQPQRHSAPARVVNDQQALLAARISGEISRVLVRVGDRVAQGQLLLELDCRDQELSRRQLAAALEQLQARHPLLTRRLARARSLYSQNNLPEETLDQRRSALAVLNADIRSAQATLARAELDIERCRIAAPFDATILEQLTATGTLVQAGAPLFRVQQEQGAELSVQLPPERVVRVRRAERLWFEFAGRAYPVRLRRAVDQIKAGRTQELRLDFTHNRPLTGAAGVLIWQAAEPLLPANLLVRHDNRLGVMVVNRDRARFVPLPDAIEGQASTIALPADTRVIIEGQFTVRDDDPIRVEGSLDDTAPAH